MDDDGQIFYRGSDVTPFYYVDGKYATNEDTPLGGRMLDDWVDKAFSDGAKKSLLTVFRRNAAKGKGYAPMLKEALRAVLDDGFNLTRSHNACADIRANRQCGSADGGLQGQ